MSHNTPNLSCAIFIHILDNAFQDIATVPSTVYSLSRIRYRDLLVDDAGLWNEAPWPYVDIIFVHNLVGLQFAKALRGPSS